MCGYCGIVYASSSTKHVDRGVLSRMNATLNHRGPDAQNLHLKDQVGLGHCRLSIIDLAGGTQPMHSADGQHVLVFNGEIYNYLQLSQDLHALGRQFKTQSDTEVILHLYALYGTDCLSKMRGMFSFALWDAGKKRLFMARDRLGKKPLVYAQIPQGIVFGSELKALLEHPDVTRDINREAIHHYLTYQYIPSPQTIFKSIRKLPPAHFAIWENGTLTVRPYWKLSFRDKTRLSLKDATTQLLDKLRQSIRLRLISDVPLGAFLSGGIDSSLIVGLMSEMSSQPVKTYSIGFEELDYSELGYARQVAKRFHCEHHEFVVKPDVAEILPKLAWHYGEPYSDSSALPSYIVSRETRRHVTVALNGDGGDENFAGYYRYAAMGLLGLWNHLPSRARRGLAQAAQAFPLGNEPMHLGWRLKRLLMLGGEPADQQYLGLINIYTETLKQTLYSSSMQQETKTWDATAYIRNILNTVDAKDGIDPYLAADLQSYLPECLMTKMDIASMAVSLETRSPLLDHEFVEMTARLPWQWKWKPLLRTKWILRHGLRGWLPDEILTRGKQGFSIPVGAWFRGGMKSYLEDLILSPQALSRGYFQEQTIRHMLAEHHAGRRDHGYHLWSLLMLELWHRVYVDREYHFS